MKREEKIMKIVVKNIENGDMAELDEKNLTSLIMRLITSHGFDPEEYEIHFHA